MGELAPNPVVFALRVSPVLVLGGAIVCLAIAGITGGEGAMIGGLVSWSSLWLGSWIVKNAINERSAKIPAQSRIQLALLLKLPLFAMIVFLISKLGIAAVGCFVAGYLLVYFALLVGAVVRPRSL